MNTFDDYIEWKDWRTKAFGTFDPLGARYFAAETGIGRDPPCRVLEVGFGNGAFLGWARSLGAEVWGIEVNPALLSSATVLLGSGRVFPDLHDRELDRFAGAFTHIVAFDVIEHVPQDRLPEFLARMALLLQRQGRIILRFPNGDSPFGRINQHGDPTHVTTIGRAKLEYFARLAGLRASTVRAPALPFTGVGAVRGLRRASVLIARRIIETLASYLYFNGRAIPMDPNLTAVLVPAPTSGRAIPARSVDDRRG